MSRYYSLPFFAQKQSLQIHRVKSIGNLILSIQNCSDLENRFFNCYNWRFLNLDFQVIFQVSPVQTEKMTVWQSCKILTKKNLLTTLLSVILTGVVFSSFTH